MNYSKTKNGFKITVKKYDNTVTVINLTTNEIIKHTFSDHIKAIMVAKAL